MTLCTLDRQALHVVFSFAQADRDTDLRLAARLLMCSQREMRACFERLADRGFVDARTFAITQAGMLIIGRLRHRAFASPSHDRRPDARAA